MAHIRTIELEVKVDQNGDEYYIAKPGNKGRIDLSKVRFTVHHPTEDGEPALLMISYGKKKKRSYPDGTLENVCLLELEKATARSALGFVHLEWFLNDWSSGILPAHPKEREDLIWALEDQGLAKVFVHNQLEVVQATTIAQNCHPEA